MKMLVSALLNAIPDLMNVLVLLLFIFSIFGILALQFFMGVSHNRCRLTPYPVAVNESLYNIYTDLEADWFINGKPKNDIVYEIINNRELYPYCHDENNIRIELDDISWNQHTSPWKTGI